jgi:hypothetical protein
VAVVDAADRGPPGRSGRLAYVVASVTAGLLLATVGWWATLSMVS